MRTEHRDQASICPFALREVSVLTELALGHLRYSLTDVPPQSNSPPGSVLGSDHARECLPVGGRECRSHSRAVPRRTEKHDSPTSSPHLCPPATLERLAREDRNAGANALDVRPPPNQVSKETMKVVVFHRRRDGYRLPLMLHLSCLLTVPD